VFSPALKTAAKRKHRVHWEQKGRDWRNVRETDVPAELVDKLDAVRADLDGEGDRLDYCRLRRPPRTDEAANSRYLKWDNLQDVESASTFALALEIASAAAYLVEYERSDPRFEVQVSYVKGGKKDSRSITFTLGDLRDDDDEEDDEENDNVVETASPFMTGMERMTQLASTDPLSFALLMQQQAATVAIQAIERSNKATVKHAIRLLRTEQRRNERTESAERHRIEKLLQHVLSNQETIQSTIFSGAGKLADIGLSFHAKAMEREQAMAGMAADAKKSETMAAMFGDGVKVAGDVAKTMFASAMQAKVQTARGGPASSSGAPAGSAAPQSGSPAASAAAAPPASTPPPTGAEQIPKEVQLVGLARRLAEVVTKADLEHVEALAPKVADAIQQLTANAEIDDVNRVLMAFHDVSFNQLNALSEGLCEQTSDVVGAFLAVWSS
jgi:hypothetical protein